MAHQYYMLVASLPYLEPFERMERLPLTRLRLEQRLSALRPDHAADYAAAERVVV